MESKDNALREYPYHLLTEYFLEGYHITLEQEYEIESIPARELLTANRFDLMAKWIYIDAKEKGIDMTHARELYIRHIEAFTQGTFTEPGKEEKNSAEKFVQVQNDLIQVFKHGEFDDSISLIPVGKDNVLLDGAHRCACAAYFNKNVTIIRFPHIERAFNYTFFRKRELDETLLDRMALEYCHTHEHLFFACFWPVASDEKLQESAMNMLQETCGSIVYETKVALNYTGLYNFMIQIYGHQSWTGTYENHHQGVKGKADQCFAKKKPLRIVIFESPTLEQVVRVKEKIRELFGLENHAIHISDNDEETRLMADLLLNINSRHFLNYGSPDNCMKFNQLFAVYRDKLLERKKQLSYIIDSSCVLSVYGMRDCRDLDFLTDDTNWQEVFDQEQEIDFHGSQLPYYSISIKDMLYDPQYYFVYQGMKFISLSVLKQMKQKRNEKKDQKDVKMITKLLRTKGQTRKKKHGKQQKKKVTMQERVLRFKCGRKAIFVWILKRRLLGAVLLGGMYPVAKLTKREGQWEQYRNLWRVSDKVGK